MEVKNDEQKKIYQWLDLAVSDLQSSRILYFADQHRTSYFLFQQAVEKANKAFALLLGFSEDTLKSFGHNPMNIHTKAIRQKQDEAKEIIDMLNKFPKANDLQLFKKFDFHKYHKELLTTVTTLQSLRNLDLVFISEDEVGELLDELYALEDEEFDGINLDDPKMLQAFQNVSEMLGEIDLQPDQTTKMEFDAILQNEDYKRAFNELIHEEMKLFHSLGIIQFALIICAYCTAKHAILPRYPVDDQDPLKVYTKELPLVRIQHELMTVLEDAITDLRHIVNKYYHH